MPKPQHMLYNRVNLGGTETRALAGTDTCYNISSTTADAVQLGSPGSRSTHPRIRHRDGEQDGGAGEEALGVMRKIQQAGT